MSDDKYVTIDCSTEIYDIWREDQKDIDNECIRNGTPLEQPVQGDTSQR